MPIGARVKARIVRLDRKGRPEGRVTEIIERSQAPIIGRLLLESTSIPVEAIAATCGFATPETMRRAFARRVGASPAAYRSRFAAA